MSVMLRDVPTEPSARQQYSRYTRDDMVIQLKKPDFSAWFFYNYLKPNYFIGSVFAKRLYELKRHFAASSADLNNSSASAGNCFLSEV